MTMALTNDVMFLQQMKKDHSNRFHADLLKERVSLIKRQNMCVHGYNRYNTTKITFD
jgi:hypothetical protein